MVIMKDWTDEFTGLWWGFFPLLFFLRYVVLFKEGFTIVALTGYFTLLVCVLSCGLTLLPVSDNLIYRVLIPI